MSLLDEKQKELETARLELELLQTLPGCKGLVDLAVSLLRAHAAVIENQIRDAGLDLVSIGDLWGQSWLRVPVVEIDRLGLEPRICDFSWRSDTHYYLVSGDEEHYSRARQEEGSGELRPAKLRVEGFPNANGISRMDDYRARDWKPSA